MDQNDRDSSTTNIRKLGLATEFLRDTSTLEAFLFEANKSNFDFVDCAWRYGNEPYIGMALKQIKSKDMSFILSIPFQSKVWPTKFSGGINKSLKFALQKIGAFTCMDTYFLHFPAETWTQNLSAYKQLMDCMKMGKTKRIGLGNFDTETIDRLFEFTGQLPHVIQMTISVNHVDMGFVEYCKSKNIELQAYEPYGEFAKNKKNPDIIAIAEKHSTSIKNILLAYLQELGIVPVAVAETAEEIHELDKSKDIHLDKDDMDKLSKLNIYREKT